MTEFEKHRRLVSGPVFLLNEFEGCMVRTEMRGRLRVYVKFKGKEEFESKQSSTIVTDTFMEWNEVTKNEYMSY